MWPKNRLTLSPSSPRSSLSPRAPPLPRPCAALTPRRAPRPAQPRAQQPAPTLRRAPPRPRPSSLSDPPRRSLEVSAGRPRSALPTRIPWLSSKKTRRRLQIPPLVSPPPLAPTRGCMLVPSESGAVELFLLSVGNLAWCERSYMDWKRSPMPIPARIGCVPGTISLCLSQLLFIGLNRHQEEKFQYLGLNSHASQDLGLNSCAFQKIRLNIRIASRFRILAFFPSFPFHEMFACLSVLLNGPKYPCLI